jgi:hypothetical protein
LFKVSQRLVTAAAQVRKRGVLELVTAVEQGSVVVSQAAKIAQLPQERQAPRLERYHRKERGEGRQEHDFYRTPKETTRAVVIKEKLPKKVCEPCCGDGAISRVLEALGHKVISSDKYDRGYGEPGRDFLKETEKQADCMMTNPPFDQIDEIVLHALDLGYAKIIVLGPITWLAGMQHYAALWRRHKLARVWVFSPRQTLWRGDDKNAEDDGGMTDYAWFVIEQDYNGLPALDWLPGESSAAA